MPFKSKAQQRYMFAKHPEIAEEFAEATPNIKKLPEHVKNNKQKTTGRVKMKHHKEHEHKKEHKGEHDDHKHMHHHHKEMHKHHMKEMHHHEKMMKKHMHDSKKK